jgi:hypothetical protein
MEIFETGSNYRLHGLNISHKIKENAIELSDPVSPDMRVEVCFLRFPPGFPAAPKISAVYSLAPALYIAGRHIIMTEEITLFKTDRNHVFSSTLTFCLVGGSTHQPGEP